MDRDRCVYLFRKALIPDMGGLTKAETEEILTEYACDRGYEDKKDYIPLLMLRYKDWQYLITCALNYYRTFFNIYKIEKLPDPNGLNRGAIINIY